MTPSRVVTSGLFKSFDRVPLERIEDQLLGGSGHSGWTLQLSVLEPVSKSRVFEFSSCPGFPEIVFVLSAEGHMENGHLYQKFFRKVPTRLNLG